MDDSNAAIIYMLVIALVVGIVVVGVNPKYRIADNIKSNATYYPKDKEKDTFENHLVNKDIIKKIIFGADFVKESVISDKVLAEKKYSLKFVESKFKMKKDFSKLIKYAQKSIKIAVKNFNPFSTVKTDLKAALERGVKVYLVTEEENSVTEGILALVDNPESPFFLKSDKTYGNPIMNNNFVIVDDRFVWFSSGSIDNLNMEKVYNSSIIIDSVNLAKIFHGEFIELLSGDFAKGEKTVNNNIQIKPELNISVYFSPEDNIEEILLKSINNVKKSVFFCTYGLESVNIAEALSNIKSETIDIKGYLDRNHNKTEKGKKVFQFFKEKDIEVKPSGFREISMHNNFFIFDEETIAVGSHYFYEKASNDDSFMVFIKSKELAAKFLEEFNLVDKNIVPFMKSKVHKRRTKNQKKKIPKKKKKKKRKKFIEGEIININNADVDLLKMLPSVGMGAAEKIIKKRKELGGFKKIDDLLEVSRFSENKIEKIKDFIKLKGEHVLKP